MAGNRRALLSVSDKTGLADFARGLVDLGFELLSTGGTRKHLEAAGLAVTDVAAYTGFPEMMDGRVKTLHPRVHGGLLGRPTLPSDKQAMYAHGITPIELVVVNLYPFEATIAKPGCTVEEAIENIDIGGPSMVRSASKNHEHVAIVTRADQYAEVLAALRSGGTTHALRRRLAGAAFEMTASYDRAIADYFAKLEGSPESAWPERLRLSLVCREKLRYGENPHQAGAFYVEANPPSASLAAATQRHGKELSYNNLLDLDAALNLVREFASPAAVILKHNNPCGAGEAGSLSEAFARAYEGDPVSAFGSIIGCNRPLDGATAEQMCLPDRFIEAIIAPGFTDEAVSLLTTKPKWKGSVRLLECPGLNDLRGTGVEYRRVSGGMLAQTLDDQPDPESEFKVVTSRAPTEQEWADLRFAWKLVKHVKSNAIVFAKGGMLLGAGAGQMSRVDSVRIAVEKSQGKSQGAVVASDAFFPFRDGLDLAAKAGIRAAIQPGGSRNDAEVIQACEEQGVAMVFTGRRHFRH
jgi:phosphoribosylaminoimidazolecarboxamide formyltransferase / IMP cyclohydrolase